MNSSGHTTPAILVSAPPPLFFSFRFCHGCVMLAGNVLPEDLFLNLTG